MNRHVKYICKSGAALLLSACLTVLMLSGCAGSKPAASSSGKAGSSALMADNDIIGGTSSDLSSSDSAAASGSSKTPSSSQPSSSKAATSSKAASSAASSAPAKVPVTVTIPEGFCVTQIAARLQANGVISDVNAFYDAVNNYDFSPYHPKGYGQANAAYSSHRRFKLEGYLYPATYNFYKNMTPQDAIGMMLRAFDDYAYGKYDDQTIILASVIEKEASGAKGPDNALQMVSAVFHNRINQGMSLQADATYYYLVNHLIGDDNIVNQYKQYYNTTKAVYNCKIPAGPICSPSKRALEAAKNPANDPSLYFVSDSDSKYYFATTYDEQKQNIQAHTIPAGAPQTVQPS